MKSANRAHCGAVGRTKEGLSNSREELASCGPAHPPKGGGERGKHGPRDGIPYQTADRPPVSNQRLPEILDGRHPSGGSRLETSSPEQTQGSPNRRAAAEGIRRTAPRESVIIKFLAAWAAWAGKAQNAGPTESVILWSTQKLAPHITQGLFPIEQPGAWAV